MIVPRSVNRLEKPIGVHMLVINTPIIDIQEYSIGMYNTRPLMS